MSTEPQSNRLYVGNIPWSTTVEELQGLFTDAENIEWGLYLSSDELITTADSLILSSSHSLGSGGYALFSGDVDIPEATIAGDWYLALMADPNDVLSESDEADNYALCPERIRVRCVDDDGDSYTALICGGDDCDASTSGATGVPLRDRMPRGGRCCRARRGSCSSRAQPHAATLLEPGSADAAGARARL